MRWAVCLLLAVVLCGWRARTVSVSLAAVCAAEPISLEQATTQAETVVVARVTRETGDDFNGYTSTLQIDGALKGVSPGPALRLSGLGYPGGVCAGGPRLSIGPTYVLFLAKLNRAPAASAAYALADGDQSVYTLSSKGTTFPPSVFGGPAQLQPVSSADFARDVGDIAGTDSARIEAVIDDLALPESVDATTVVTATTKSDANTLTRWLPSRDVVLGIGIGALVLALLIALLWQPREPRWR